VGAEHSSTVRSGGAVVVGRWLTVACRPPGGHRAPMSTSGGSQDPTRGRMATIEVGSSRGEGGRGHQDPDGGGSHGPDGIPVGRPGPLPGLAEVGSWSWTRSASGMRSWWARTPPSSRASSPGSTRPRKAGASRAGSVNSRVSAAQPDSDSRPVASWPMVPPRSVRRLSRDGTNRDRWRRRPPADTCLSAAKRTPSGHVNSHRSHDPCGWPDSGRRAGLDSSRTSSSATRHRVGDDHGRPAPPDRRT
jgi:hypothetical protein